jgi:hypothetical protein
LVDLAENFHMCWQHCPKKLSKKDQYYSIRVSDTLRKEENERLNGCGRKRKGKGLWKKKKG